MFVIVGYLYGASVWYQISLFPRWIIIGEMLFEEITVLCQITIPKELKAIVNIGIYLFELI